MNDTEKDIASFSVRNWRKISRNRVEGKLLWGKPRFILDCSAAADDDNCDIVGEIYVVKKESVSKIHPFLFEFYCQQSTMHPSASICLWLVDFSNTDLPFAKFTYSVWPDLYSLFPPKHKNPDSRKSLRTSPSCKYKGIKETSSLCPAGGLGKAFMFLRKL